MSRFRPIAGLTLLLFSVVARGAYEDETTLSARGEQFSRDYQTMSGIDVQYSPISYPNYDYYSGLKPNRLGTGLRVAYEFLPFDNRFGKIGLGLGAGFDFVPNIDFGDGRRATLNVFPLGAFLSYRADYTRNQILVPFGKIGSSMVLVNQSSDTGGGRPGAQTYYGLDMGGGVELCLNALDRDAAASLLRTIGIHDSYITFEYISSQSLGKKRAPDMSHSEYRIGLRFEI
jgi:hypothetical protein